MGGNKERGVPVKPVIMVIIVPAGLYPLPFTRVMIIPDYIAKLRFAINN